MKNVNELNIQTGYLYTTDGKKFDISVILNFPTKTEYDNCTGIDNFPSVNLIDFYFGTPNDRDTKTFVVQFIEKQQKFEKLLTKLYTLKSANPDDTEIDEQIEFVKSQIVKLH